MRYVVLFFSTTFGLMILVPHGLPVADAQTATVDFLVSSAISIDETNEELVFKAAAGKTSLDASCNVPETGEYPLQNVAVVMEGGSETLRQFAVVVLEPVTVETRVGNLVLAGVCNVGATHYKRFRGAIR